LGLSSFFVSWIFLRTARIFGFYQSCPAINDSNSCGAATLYFGSLINTSADVQKLTAKQGGANLVKDGIWRFARHINYFGDLLRYLSFSVVAGSIWAYFSTSNDARSSISTNPPAGTEDG
jgi:steroid 5-alpha reductase family enzyme